MNNKSCGFKTEFSISTPISVSIDITNKCNLHCLHCYNSSGEKHYDELNEQELKSLITQVAAMKTSYVCLCGGEPLCSPYLFDIIDILRGNTCSINMVSNGFLLTKTVAKELKEHGLNMLQISVDGLTSIEHDTFRGRSGSYDRAINAVKQSVSNGISTAVSCCPNKLNVKSISMLIDYCYQLGVTSFRMMPLIPMGRGSRINNLILSTDEYFSLKQLISKKKKEYINANYSIEWGDPLDHLHRMPVNSKMGYSTHMMLIKSNGDLTITPYLPIVVGNVRSHSLLEYWEAGFKDIWRHEKIVEYVSRIETITDLGLIGNQSTTEGDKLRIDLLY